jgi:two-component sensor histidine kinase
LLGIDRAVPLGLFLNEALMNAFKHAFPKGFTGDKVIRVLVRHGDEQDELRIRDSGIGFKPGDKQPSESSSHTEFSLGLTLISLLTDQLGGEMNITSEAGTTIRLLLPRPADRIQVDR